MPRNSESSKSKKKSSKPSKSSSLRKEDLSLAVIAVYVRLYKNKFNVDPALNWAICCSMINKHLRTHSQKGISRIIELYFEDPSNNTRPYHLPNILSAWSFNKYLPRMKYDPMIYGDAAELNKELY